MQWKDIKEAFGSASLLVVSAHYKNFSVIPYMSIILSVKNQVNKLTYLQLSNDVDNTVGRTEINMARTEFMNFLEYLHTI